MLTPDWKYARTITKRIRILKVNKDVPEIDVLDVDSSFPFCIDANKETDLDKLSNSKLYQAKIKVFEAELTAEFEKQWLKEASGDIDLLKGLQVMKETGAKPTKYELITITPI